ALPDRAGRLQLVDRARPLGEAQRAHPARDRAAGDDRDVVAGTVQRSRLLAHVREDIGARLTGVVGDDRGAELEDDGTHPAAAYSRSRAAVPPAGRRRACAGARPPLRRVELELDAADLDVVAGGEAGVLERLDHADALEAALEVGHRLLVLDVVPQHEPVDPLSGDAEAAVVQALDLEPA